MLWPSFGRKWAEKGKIWAMKSVRYNIKSLFEIENNHRVCVEFIKELILK
jgi:hypothetical protein